MEHHLIQLPDRRWTCSTCQWYWKSKPQSECPGVPRYDCAHMPEPFKTQTELGKIGLKLAFDQKPAACVYVPRKMDYDWFYDVAQAVPKKQATPAQLAALEKGRSLMAESIARQIAIEGYYNPIKMD
ncbi:hypothetical protein NDI45_25235 [Leptolyngbya sp. GB1-A1]|uniref:hypothetical protein n=1 Tax=Leptolyngbya sp. GB1-A1 TaxID=2933908 RepID=UPI0032975B1C